jgi:hypothetical protein
MRRRAAAIDFEPAGFDQHRPSVLKVSVTEGWDAGEAGGLLELGGG